jgi:sulfatase modifying factor 1
LHRIPAGEYSKVYILEGDRLTEQKVIITRPYYISRAEVTRGQFRKFVEAKGHLTAAEALADPAGAKPQGAGSVRRKTWRDPGPGFEQTDDHPVVHVTWADAAAFCAWMSEKEGVTYRLPKEAEWEYAARAGASGLLPFPGGEAVVYANVADASFKRFLANGGGKRIDQQLASFFPGDDGYVFTAPVGSFRPNEFGLVDTYGNVTEWCQDWYTEAANLVNLPQRDPEQVERDPEGRRVARGGSFASGADKQLYLRYHFSEKASGADTGFRVVVEIPEGGK